MKFICGDGYIDNLARVRRVSMWRWKLFLHVLLLVFFGAAPPAFTEQANGFFGVASHSLHTRQIYPKMDDMWLLTRTAPIQQDLGTPWVAEAIYALTAKRSALVDDGTANVADRARISERRKLIDSWFSIYDRMGKRVVLTVMAAAPQAKNSRAINDSFGDWIAELVSLHPSIEVVQLHNEPNLKSFWPDTPEDYVKLYASIAEKVRKRRPQITISVGAISSLSWPKGRAWQKSAIDAGMLKFADAVSVHPYNLKSPPEVDPHLHVSLRDAMIAFWKEIEAASPPGKHLKLYLTELGYSSADDGIAGIGSEVLQANYLARLMMLYIDFRLRDGIPIDAVFWYDLKNDGPDSTKQGHNWGLVSHNLDRKKPAFETYKRIISAIPDVSQMKASSDQFVADVSDVEITPWISTTGVYTIGLWRTGEGEKAVSLTFKTGGKLKCGSADVLDVQSGVAERIAAIADGSKCKITVPDVSGVKILKLSG